MKQLVILSGKGGTGKTSVAAAFAHLAAEGDHPVHAVLADADVDASNLDLVLDPTVLEAHNFVSGAVAVIDAESCEGCGNCAEVCRFDAISFAEVGNNSLDREAPHIDPIACDGCAACVYQCPTQAIHMEPQLAGQWFRSDTRYGPLFHAALYPAQENSGKLVTMVKQQARLLALAEYTEADSIQEGQEDFDLIIIDGPPGIGCPVISAASGADLVLIVTEPTVAGVHDLERIQKTTEHFGVPALVCINKADLNLEGSAAIEAFCRQRGTAVVGHIPFDLSVTQAMVQGQPVTAYGASAAAAALRHVWGRILAALEQDGA
jgi:MinD superfamily P-loop ATPase